MKYDVFSNFLQCVQSRHRSATAAKRNMDRRDRALRKNEGTGTTIGLVVRYYKKELDCEDLQRHLEAEAKRVRMGGRL